MDIFIHYHYFFIDSIKNKIISGSHDTLSYVVLVAYHSVEDEEGNPKKSPISATKGKDLSSMEIFLVQLLPTADLKESYNRKRARNIS